ncbi:MAG: [protein-PII] uridylyltransferase, partial [Sphingomicrobium sp.]
DRVALDNLLVTDARGRPYGDPRYRKRLVRAIEAALAADDAPPPPALDRLPSREQAFRVAPRVLVAGKASSRTTVVEVNARDRPGLLARLAREIHAAGHQLHSAHIATYGERAVDVFYLTSATGRKLSADEAAALRESLLAVAGSEA